MIQSKKTHIIYLSLLLLALLLAGVFLFHLFREKHDEGIVTLYGNVDVRQVDISFRVGGRVISMPFEEGDLVEPGQLMASIEEQPYKDLVKEAEAKRDAYERDLENAEEIFQRREELVSEGGVSQEDRDNALSARDVALLNVQEARAAVGVALKNYVDTQVFCPNAGTILTRVREPGTVVNPTDPVYTLSLLSPIWIRAYVPERHLGDIYPDMPAKIYTDTKGGPVYEGYVGFISPIAEFTPKTVESIELRTDLVYRLRIYTENENWELKQGMPVTVKLQKREKGNARSRH